MCASFYTFLCWGFASDGLGIANWFDQHADELAIGSVSLGFGCGVLGAVRRWNRSRWGPFDIVAAMPVAACVVSFLELWVFAHTKS
jgi:hypothetical protein